MRSIHCWIAFLILASDAQAKNLCDDLAHEVAKICTECGHGNHYRISRERFILDVNAALRSDENNFLFGGKVTGLETRKKVFRLDKRPPDEVVNQGGFWPNPAKPLGTLAEHVGGGTGTGSYVSFTIAPKPDSLLRERFILQEPSHVLLGRVKSAIDAGTWNKWISSGHKFAKNEQIPDIAQWSLYEYRTSQAEGVPIYGGEYYKEREFVTRGIPLAHLEAVRIITVTVPLEVYTFPNGIRELVSPTLPTPAFKARFQIKYGPWKLLTP